MLETLRIGWAMQKAAYRSQLQYRANFFVAVTMGVVYQGSGLAFIWVVLHDFHSINGWTFPHLMFLYALRLASHACWVVPFNQLDFLEDRVRDGAFDRYLVRPLNPLVQTMTGGFQLNVIGDAVTAVVLLTVSLSTSGVNLSALKVVYLMFALVGGALAEGALLLATSALSFRFIQTWAGQYLVDNLFLMFGSYPLRIFGRTASWALTWLVPVAFVAYVPASALTGRIGELQMPAAMAWAAPIVGLAWFTGAYLLWRRLMNGYQSTGN